MTEDEAKTKWCPHAVASHTDPRAVRGYENEHGPAGTFNHNCIGSACMAWRSRPPYSDAPGPAGYCGLAGAPQ